MWSESEEARVAAEMYSENKALHADIQVLHKMMDQLLVEDNAAINQAKELVMLLPMKTIAYRSRA